MKPELLTACFTALLHASLLVTGAWVFLLTQGKTSAARRSLACRLTIAAALLLTAIRVLPALPILPAPVISQHTAAPLPQGSGMADGNLLLSPDPATDSTPAPTSLSPALPTDPPGFSWQLSPGVSKGIFLLWLAGGIGVGALWCRSLLVRRRVMRESVKTTTLPGLEAAATLPGWALVNEVRLVPAEITPCVWGIRKTILALPASSTAWPAGKLRLVLAHECAHLLRRDPLWQALTHAFLAFFWFHPLAWNLARRSQAADEQAADDTVLRTTPDAPSYAALLVECARHFSLPHPTAATTHAMATPANLTTRVEAILTPETDRRPATFRSFLAPAVLIASIAAGIALCTPGIVIAEVPAPIQPEAEPEIKAPAGEESPGIVSIENATVVGDKMLFPDDKQHPGRKVYEFTGSAKFTSPILTIEADQMTHTYDETQEKKALLSLSARGTVRIKGLVGSDKISATAEELWISNETGEMTLTGWPKANIMIYTYVGINEDSKIIVKPNGINTEACRVITTPSPITDPASLKTSSEASPNFIPDASKPNSVQKDASDTLPAPLPKEPNATPAEGPTKTPPTSPPSTTPPNLDSKPDSTPSSAPALDVPKKPFEWKIVSLDGRDFVTLSQIKDFYYFPQLRTEESGDFIMPSKTMIFKGSSGSQELFINNVKFLLAQPVQPSGGGLLISRQDLADILDPIIRPSYIQWPGKFTTVVIDPGHGGDDVKAGVGPAGDEAAYTLDTALRLQRQLEKFGLKVVLTRQSDALISSEDRTTLADAVPDAVFISLRFRKGPADQHGIQTFYPENTRALPRPVEDKEQSVYSPSCVGLATAVHAKNLYKLRSNDEGVRSAAFEILTSTIRAPAIIVDGGNLGHPEEAARIATETYRQQLAESIAGGVRNFRRAITKTERVPLRQ